MMWLVSRFVRVARGLAAMGGAPVGLCAAAFVLGGAATAPPARVALVVGVAHYSTYPLNNSINDARLVAAELKRLGFAVRILIDPTRDQLISAVDELQQQARTSTAAILYFSGHGMEVDGANYLLPKDARFDREAIIPTTIVASKLREGVLKAGSVRLIILDACRNNPLGGSAGQAGLARESAGSSSEVVTIMAAAPGQVASDGQANGNGPFAVALAAALRTPGMTVGELPGYVQSEVKQLTKDQQVPDLQGIWRDVNWSFSTTPNSAATRDAEELAVTRRKEESLFWESIKDSNDPADYKAYIADVDSGEFPGLFRSLAFKRLDQLAKSPSASEASPGAAAAGRSADAKPRPASADAAAGADPMADGRSAFARGDFDAAIKAWKIAAASGDAAAMSNLGLMSVNGFGEPADLSKAADWFRRSAQAGSPAGMVNYAACLLNGGGVPKDQKAGLSWLERAARNGSPSAMEALGEIYARGERVPRDDRQAARWMQAAADAGDGPALTDLAYWYEEGIVMPKNGARAFDLYTRAALSGRSAAMVRLGQFYEAGDSVRQDLVQAATWYQRAVAAGSRDGLRDLAALYENGRGVPRDVRAAIGYYRRAAQAGDAQAQQALVRLGAAG